MASSLCIILCALLFLQGTWSVPAKNSDSESTAVTASDETDKKDKAEVSTSLTLTPGTQLSNNMNENLLKVMDNLRIGTVALTTPVIKFGLDTVPSLLTTGVKTMAGAASKLALANKKGFGKIFNGVASVAGGGAVLGSSVLGGNMQILGSGLGVAGNLVEAAAKFGLDLTGNIAETGALTNTIMAGFTHAILEGAGKGMSLAGDGITFLSKDVAKVIDAIGNSISSSIKNTQDTMTKWFKSGSAKFQDGAITLTTAAQVNYYNALQWYLHNLLAMEVIMDKLTETINNSSGDKKESSSTDKESGKGSSEDKKTVKQS